MSKMGIGSFFSGAAQGYQQGTKLRLEEEKAEREKELFGLQKQKAEIDLKREKDEEAFKDDMKQALAPIYAQIASATQPAPPQNGLQGPVEPPKPIDLPTISEQFADTSLAVAFKHGRVTPQQLKEARDLRKQLDEEGVTDAVRAKLAGASDADIAQIFNKRGKFKFDPATMRTEVVQDKSGVGMPNVVVYERGKDGKEKEVFNYANLAMTSLSKDMYSQLNAEGKRAKLKAETDVYTTGMTTQATLAAANAKSDHKLNPEVAAFNTRMEKDFESVSKLTGLSLDPTREVAIRAEISALGRKLIDQDKFDGNKAYEQALRTVYTTYGIPLPKPVAQPAPKK